MECHIPNSYPQSYHTLACGYLWQACMQPLPNLVPLRGAEQLSSYKKSEAWGTADRRLLDGKVWGWQPQTAWKGQMPIEECVTGKFCKNQRFGLFILLIRGIAP